MTPLHMLAVAAAGTGAGAINAVVGSGTLLTFPTLLAVGLPPVTANVSNTVGLVPGSASAIVGYRRELAGQGRVLAVLGAASVSAALIGGLLLLVLPQSAFRAVVPALIAIGCLLVALQPLLQRLVRPGSERATHRRPLLLALVFATGGYGGYFGAGQGVLLIAVLGLLLESDLQRVNAVKNVLAGLANLAASVLFIAVAHVDWTAAALIAAGSVAGASIGARFGRRLPAVALRVTVVVIGLVAVWSLLR